MIAIFKTGGKQYCAQPGQILKVEKLEGKKGDNLTFNEILVISDKSNNAIGNPLIQGASINAKIIDQIRGDKIIVFKKRRRKNYKLTRGHKQYLTVVKIESINNNGKKSTPKVIAKKIDDSKNSPKEKQLSTKKIEKNASEKKSSLKKTIKRKTVEKKTLVKKKKSSKK